MESFKKEYLSKFNLDIDYLRIVYPGEYNNIIFVLETKYNNILSLLTSIYKKHEEALILKIAIYNFHREVSLKYSIDILYENEKILQDMIKQIKQ